jgi:hypothetical protein
VSKLFIAVGVVLILGAILWWALGVNNLVKVPESIDTRIDFEGTDTFYVNPITNEFLPPGQELVLPTTAYLTMVSENDQYSSKKAVISGVSETNISGQEFIAPYRVVVDRKTCFNVPDDRAYVFTEGNYVDRSGAISYGWPIGTKKIDYPMWKEELAAPMIQKFIGEADKGGVHVYNFRAEVKQQEMATPYIEFAKLPASMDFNKFKDAAKALGLDLDGLMTLARQKFSPEDLAALNEALAAGVPLKYYLDDEEEFSVDPKSGLIIDGYLAKATISVKADLTGMTQLTAVFTKYASDPALGAALTKLASAAPMLEQMPGQTVMKTDSRQTPDSVSKSIADAKKTDNTLEMVKLYIPLALLAAGLILLLVGVVILPRKQSQPRAE